MRTTAYHGNSIGRQTDLALNIIFAILGLVCVLPLVLVMMISFSSQASIVEHGYKIWPSEITFSAYSVLFKDWKTIMQAYGVTIFITIAGTVLNLLFTGLYAYPLSRRDYPYRGIFTFILFFTMLFNGGFVTKYLVYTMLLGIGNTYISLILPLLLAGFNVIIMRTFFQTTIHPSLIESAKIDGAGELKIFFRIIMPLSLPVFATMGLFSVLAYWNDWFNAMLFITDNNKYPLQYMMIKVLENIQFIRANLTRSGMSSVDLANLPGESMQMAMALVAMGPIIMVYPFFQKYFIKGLTIGAVKG